MRPTPRNVPAATVLLACALGAAATPACSRPPVVRNCSADAEVPCPNLNDPAGRIEGTIIYQGPPPPYSARGVATGRVVLLLFEYDNPPPPQGSASTAIAFQTVSAADLFRNASTLPDGSVRATIAYSFPGITRGGEYQIRAFYSRNESITVTPEGPDPEPFTVPSGFHPLYGVRNLPVRGDVGGGAIADPSAPLPQFVRIRVGERVVSDAGRPAGFVLPESGYVASGVTVFIGRVFETERPMFHVVTEDRTVIGPTGPVSLMGPSPANRIRTREVGAPPGVNAPGEVPPPGAALLDYASATGLVPPRTAYLEMIRNPVIRQPETGADVPSFNIAVSLRPDECDIAALAGVRCPSTLADAFRHIGFFELALDRDENGSIDLTRDRLWVDAHPTLFTTNPLAAATNGRLPWIYPLVILAKLHEPNALERRLLLEGQNGRLAPDVYARLRTALNRPETLDLSDPNDPRYPVLVFGSVVPNGEASNFLLRPWTRGHRQAEAYPRVIIIPVAVEVRGADRVYDYHAIITPSTREIVAARTPFLPPTYRCYDVDPEIPLDDPQQYPGIPAGRYAINLIGPGGQAWTLPNDLMQFTPPATIERSNALCTDVMGLRVCGVTSQGTFVRMHGLEMQPPDAICPNPPVRTTPRPGS